MKQLTITYVLPFLYIKTIVLINVQCIRVNQSEAVRLCKDKGGLTDSSHFPRVDVTFSDYGLSRGSVLYSQLKNVDLKDGESVWVAGYAKYSDSIYNHWGCYKYDHLITLIAKSDKQEHRGFYQCSTFCENQNGWISINENIHVYFSINTTSCFCLQSSDWRPNRTACPYENKQDVHLELFKRRQRYATKGARQCASVGIDSRRLDWEETTSKCIEDKNVTCYPIKNTIPCSSKSDTDIHLDCDIGISTTWMGGVKQCNIIGGIMAPYLSSSLREIWKWGKQYWFGAVSAYTIQPELADACLAVTRLDDQLVLEPDDCKAENSVICANDFMHNSEDKHVIPFSPTSTPFNKQTTHSPVPITSPAASSAVTNTVLIIVGCCVVLAVGAAISFFIYKHKNLSQKDGRKHLMAQTSSTLGDNDAENVTENDYATVDENEMVRAKFGASEVSDHLLKSPTIDGTLGSITLQKNLTRNTLRRKNILESHKTVPLSKATLDNQNEDGQDTASRMSDVYNVLSYNQPARPNQEQREGEFHVYDHMPTITTARKGDDKTQNTFKKCDQNEYDTTESVQVLLHGDYATTQSLQQAGRADGEYDTTESVQVLLHGDYATTQSLQQADRADGEYDTGQVCTDQAETQ